jgi:hypothetical protein
VLRLKRYHERPEDVERAIARIIPRMDFPDYL